MRIFLASIAFCLFSVLPGTAQVDIPDEVTCRSCSIELVQNLELGRTEGLGSIAGHPASVRRDSRGRFWIMAAGSLPAVYDPDGQFITSIGRFGYGPREFQDAHDIFHVDGDSVVVLDIGSQRATVVAPDLVIVRTVTFPGQVLTAAPLAWPGVVLANAIIQSSSHVGWPLHIMSFEGEQAQILSSMGLNNGELRPGAITELINPLARSNDATIWSSETSRFRLAEWSREGSLKRGFERKPSWFTERTSGSTIGNPSTPPPSKVRAVATDEDGLLWVFVHVPATTWRKAWTRVAPDVREVGPGDILPEYLFDTVVEVIDPQQGRVIVRRRISGSVITAMGNRQVSIYRVSDDGIPYVVVSTLRLVRA